LSNTNPNKTAGELGMVSSYWSISCIGRKAGNHNPVSRRECALIVWLWSYICWFYLYCTVTSHNYLTEQPKDVLYNEFVWYLEWGHCIRSFCKYIIVELHFVDVRGTYYFSSNEQGIRGEGIYYFSSNQPIIWCKGIYYFSSN